MPNISSSVNHRVSFFNSVLVQKKSQGREQEEKVGDIKYQQEEKETPELEKLKSIDNAIKQGSDPSNNNAKNWVYSYQEILENGALIEKDAKLFYQLFQQNAEYFKQEKNKKQLYFLYFYC